MQIGLRHLSILLIGLLLRNLGYAVPSPPGIFSELEQEFFEVLDQEAWDQASQKLSEMGKLVEVDPAFQAPFYYCQGVLTEAKDDLERATHHFINARQTAIEQGDSRIHGRSLVRLTNLQKEKLGDSAIVSQFREAIKLSRACKDTLGLISGLYELGSYQLDRDRSADGRSCLREASQLSKASGSWESLATIYNFQGYHFFNRGMYAEAMPHCLESLKAYQQLAELKDIARTQNMLGSILYRLGDTDKAAEYFNKALISAREQGYNSIQASVLTNLGVMAQEAGDYQSGLDYQLQAYELYRQLGKESGQSACLTNIAYNYEQVGQFDMAIQYQLQALEIDQRIGDVYGIAISLCNLGEYHRSSGQHPKAIDYYLQSKEAAHDVGFHGLDPYIYKGLSQSYTATEDFEQALRYEHLSDSVNTPTPEETDTAVAKVWEYEGEQKDKQIQVLEKRTETQSGWILYGSIFAIILLGIVVFFWIYVLKRKQRQEKLLKDQERSLEEKEVGIKNLQSNVLSLKEELAAQKALLAELSKDGSELGTSSRTGFIEKLKGKRLWPTYLAEFELVYPDFLQSLRQAHPQLSTTDLRLLSLMKLNQNVHEIADFLSITPAGVKKAKQRIRKKMELNTSQKLDQYLAGFRS